MSEPDDTPASPESEAARARSRETIASLQPHKQPGFVRPELRTRNDEPAASPIAIEGRALATGRLMPAITALNDEMLELAHLMVHGLTEDDEIEGKPVSAGWPLTLRQAARYLGVRLKRSRDIAEAPVFAAELARQLKARRNAELARNLQTAVTIRDDPGLGLAADRTVRLKAISVIEGTDGKGVNINISNTNVQGGQSVTPGYVIDLSKFARPAVPDAPSSDRPMITIEGTVTAAKDQAE